MFFLLSPFKPKHLKECTHHNFFPEFYVHGTMHLSNTKSYKYQRDATFFSFIWCYNSKCFEHSLRPSSGAFKPIEPWNNIVHTAIDSYTGFIISRTHDKHQWLLLQFIILPMMDANCIRNM